VRGQRAGGPGARSGQAGAADYSQRCRRPLVSRTRTPACTHTCPPLSHPPSPTSPSSSGLWGGTAGRRGKAAGAPWRTLGYTAHLPLPAAGGRTCLSTTPGLLTSRHPIHITSGVTAAQGSARSTLHLPAPFRDAFCHTCPARALRPPHGGRGYLRYARAAQPLPHLYTPRAAHLSSAVRATRSVPSPHGSPRLCLNARSTACRLMGTTTGAAHTPPRLVWLPDGEADDDVWQPSTGTPARWFSTPRYVTARKNALARSIYRRCMGTDATGRHLAWNNPHSCISLARVSARATAWVCFQLPLFQP